MLNILKVLLSLLLSPVGNHQNFVSFCVSLTVFRVILNFGEKICVASTISF